MVARDELLKAIEQVESGGRRNAVSPKGARGRMQVMPATARQPGYKVKPARDESEEEYTRVGKDYAMALLKHYGGDLEATLVAYNYGPGNANKWIASGRNKSDLPKETRNYITRVGKQLGGDKMAKRPLEFIKQDKLSALTKKAIKNPDSADARKVVRELIARNLPVPDALKGSLGRARAAAGVGSPVPRPKRKPPVPKAKASVPKAKKQNDVLKREAASRKAEAGQKRLESRLRQTQDKTPMAPPGKNPTEGQFSYTNPGRNPTEAEFATPPRPGRNPTEAEFATPPRPGKNPTETDLMYMIGQDRSFNVPRGNTVRPPIESGGSYLDNIPGRNPTEAEFATPPRPGKNPTEDQFRAMRDNIQADYVSSGGRSQGRGGIDSGLQDFIKMAGGRDAFKPDAIDRGLASLGGGEVPDVMAKAEATYLNSLYEKRDGEAGEGLTTQEEAYMDNFGKKKGGRLKKKPVAKKRTVVKKKTIVKKKAVKKKTIVKKKAVKKSTTRKRAALRGHRAELRGG